MNKIWTVITMIGATLINIETFDTREKARAHARLVKAPMFHDLKTKICRSNSVKARRLRVGFNGLYRDGSKPKTVRRRQGKKSKAVQLQMTF